MLCQFTLGLRVQGKADRIVVDAEDALVAALKVKAERPVVAIMYVRRLNRRSDTRHPRHIDRSAKQTQLEFMSLSLGGSTMAREGSAGLRYTANQWRD